MYVRKLQPLILDARPPNPILEPVLLQVIWDDLNALAVLNVGTRVRTLRPVVGLALLRVSSVRLGAAHPREILLVSISLPCPCQTLAKFKSLLARLFRHLLNRPVFKC